MISRKLTNARTVIGVVPVAQQTEKLEFDA